MYVYFILFILLNFNDPASANNRQKRCIVIQKQSGTHGDSSENDGDDDDYRKPQPKEPRPDSHGDFRNDVENIQPEFLKYKLPMKTETFPRLRRRFFRRYL